MKAGLIIKLIEAHNSENESLFEKALGDLADDEEKKGNASIAMSLKKAYSSDKKRTASFSGSPISNMSYSVQGIMPLPKDKDSTLELLDVIQSTVKLSDIALTEKTSEVLSQIINEQKNAEDLLRKGITPTNRVLFCGPPGCGKTLAANAIAGELDLPMAYVRLDGLVSSYLGQTGTNIRKIFEFVKNKRMMLFLDEFDTIAKKRDDSNELGELKRVVTTLLQNLDSMQANVFLVAATNHHHLLDPAIWRRFDVSILMELPNQQQRETIINKFLSEYFEGISIKANILNILTNGMSGAQICNFMQSLAKNFVINGVNQNEISIEEIAKIWLKHATLFASEDNEAYIKALFELSKHGIPVRTLEKITGIPKSTLSYRFSKEDKTDGRE